MEGLPAGLDFGVGSGGESTVEEEEESVGQVLDVDLRSSAR